MVISTPSEGMEREKVVGRLVEVRRQLIYRRLQRFLFPGTTETLIERIILNK
jgi:hypothetical protein